MTNGASLATDNGMVDRAGRSALRVVVIGGTGLIGSRLVSKLVEHGHTAISASPNSGVNTITGAGLRAALEGADVVVDVSNSPSFEDDAVMKFFETSTNNLLAAEADAGVRHHVALSVVGTDRLLQSGYFRAKQAQERLIQSSGIPHSIVRATQFFEFVGRIADEAAEGHTVRVTPALIQPMAAEDVASAMERAATEAPLNGIVEIAGPEPFRMDELVRRTLAFRNDPREVVTDPRASYFGLVLAERALLPGDGARLGAISLHDWLGRQAGSK